ncbi:MAG: hypothetical protein HYS13_02070 [Planctomycetia bacterium]|nr:hypothetical protein [Planctomycetia bacterium]
MIYRGHVKDGVIVLDENGRLPEGAAVDVSLAAEEHGDGRQVESLYDRLKDVVGAAKGLPPDLAKNHDHYLHGRQKP